MISCVVVFLTHARQWFKRSQANGSPDVQTYFGSSHTHRESSLVPLKNVVFQNTFLRTGIHSLTHRRMLSRGGQSMSSSILKTPCTVTMAFVFANSSAIKVIQKIRETPSAEDSPFRV